MWDCRIDDVVLVNSGEAPITVRAWVYADLRHHTISMQAAEEPVTLPAGGAWHGDLSFTNLLFAGESGVESNDPFHMLTGTLDLVLTEVGTDREFRIPFTVPTWSTRGPTFTADPVAALNES